MEPRFTRGEYWLLESVVETTHAIGILTDPELELALNKKGHGLSRDGLRQTLERLFAEGLIEAYRHHPSDFYQEIVLGKLSSEEIAKALNQKSLFHLRKKNVVKRKKPQGRGNSRYRLTAKGGAAWEAFAAPNWNRFIDDSATTVSLDLKDGCIEEVICAHRELLEQYFCALKRLKAGVDESSIIWDELRPWQATYWKELPVGYRVRFRYLCDRSSQPDWYEVRTAEDEEAHHRLMWLRDWWYSWR